jgi:phosphatidylserine/phosphatidylglycerophosphate/cardiolipin synthase-like enzyme
MTWTADLSIRLDGNKLARMGAALWSQIGREIGVSDLSWGLGLFGPAGDRLILDALHAGGAVDKDGVLGAPSLARWLGDLTGSGGIPRLVWTLPASHPMAAKIGDSYTKAILGVIGNTRSELVMTSPFMQEHGISSLMEALVDALGRGVKLTVLTHHADDLGSSQSIAVEELRREATRLGKSLRVFTADAPVGSMLHAKLVIADEDVMVLGSANLTSPGLEQNIEAGVVLGGGREAKAAKQVVAELERTGLVRMVFDTGDGGRP